MLKSSLLYLSEWLTSVIADLIGLTILQYFTVMTILILMNCVWVISICLLFHILLCFISAVQMIPHPLPGSFCSVWNHDAMQWLWLINFLLAVGLWAIYPLPLLLLNRRWELLQCHFNSHEDATIFSYAEELFLETVSACISVLLVVLCPWMFCKVASELYFDPCRFQNDPLWDVMLLKRKTYVNCVLYRLLTEIQIAIIFTLKAPGTFDLNSSFSAWLQKTSSS